MALDLAAKLDETAEFLCGAKWGNIVFPAPFGRPLLPAEQRVHELDEKTGASLKLTILNPKGHVWTMVAGGGASVVYADTVCDLGFGKELANYGEYSGDPSEELTYEYAKCILGLLTDAPDPAHGKVLIIGGGIANFTNVAATFQGIVRALKDFGPKLAQGRVSVFVRRGGPNYQAGLKMMRDVGQAIGVDMAVFGPEENIVSIVPMALAKLASLGPMAKPMPFKAPATTAATKDSPAKRARVAETAPAAPLFTNATRTVVFGMQTTAVQGMLDFDHICARKTPSVRGHWCSPLRGTTARRCTGGQKETSIPVFKDLGNCLRKHPDVSVFINFSSFRSAFQTSMEALQFEQLKVICIIAEGIPEQQTRRLIKEAGKRGVVIIGPATVGAIKPACIRLGNTGGMIDNLIQAKLYRAGSVGLRVQVGGHVQRAQQRNLPPQRRRVRGRGHWRRPLPRHALHRPRAALPGRRQRQDHLPAGRGRRRQTSMRFAPPSRAGGWTSPSSRGALARARSSLALRCSLATPARWLRATGRRRWPRTTPCAPRGAVVPGSFATFGETLGEVFQGLVKQGKLVVKPEPPVPTVPMDFTWAKRLGLVRKPAAFVSTISDDRGEELIYAGMPISQVL